MKVKKRYNTTDRIYKRRSTINLIVIFTAFAIALSSVYFTRIIVEELKEREQRFIMLYANSLEYTINEDNQDELSFVVQQIMAPNTSIPIILTNSEHQPLSSKNVFIEPGLPEDRRDDILLEELKEMKSEHDPIMITLRDDNGDIIDIQYVYYRNSVLLSRLEYYPLVQLSIIAIFGIIAYVAFNFSKTAEQNRVWAGLAKETAHQLGTPISSLMAWIEYFKENESLFDQEIVSDLEKDVHRLEMITARFSSIGSIPVLTYENIPLTIENTISYLRKRLSKKVDFSIHAKPSDLRAKINKPLFEWVIENLCKNAVDSMSGVGMIDIKVKKSIDDKIIIDITDTGKGIPKSKIKDVFSPGYTTKSRGWGLGLTLVKRIIEKYHEGKIFIKNTELDQGTTFRIMLKS